MSGVHWYIRLLVVANTLLQVDLPAAVQLTDPNGASTSFASDQEAGIYWFRLAGYVEEKLLIKFWDAVFQELEPNPGQVVGVSDVRDLQGSNHIMFTPWLLEHVWPRVAQLGYLNWLVLQPQEIMAQIEYAQVTQMAVKNFSFNLCQTHQPEEVPALVKLLRAHSS